MKLSVAYFDSKRSTHKLVVHLSANIRAPRCLSLSISLSPSRFSLLYFAHYLSLIDAQRNVHNFAHTIHSCIPAIVICVSLADYYRGNQLVPFSSTSSYFCLLLLLARFYSVTARALVCITSVIALHFTYLSLYLSLPAATVHGRVSVRFVSRALRSSVSCTYVWCVCVVPTLTRSTLSTQAICAKNVCSRAATYLQTDVSPSCLSALVYEAFALREALQSSL